MYTTQQKTPTEYRALKENYEQNRILDTHLWECAQWLMRTGVGKHTDGVLSAVYADGLQLRVACSQFLEHVWAKGLKAEYDEKKTRRWYTIIGAWHVLVTSGLGRVQIHFREVDPTTYLVKMPCTVSLAMVFEDHPTLTNFGLIECNGSAEVLQQGLELFEKAWAAGVLALSPETTGL